MPVAHDMTLLDCCVLPVVQGGHWKAKSVSDAPQMWWWKCSALWDFSSSLQLSCCIKSFQGFAVVEKASLLVKLCCVNSLTFSKR